MEEVDYRSKARRSRGATAGSGASLTQSLSIAVIMRTMTCNNKNNNHSNSTGNRNSNGKNNGSSKSNSNRSCQFWVLFGTGDDEDAHEQFHLCCNCNPPACSKCVVVTRMKQCYYHGVDRRLQALCHCLHLLDPPKSDFSHRLQRRRPH